MNNNPLKPNMALLVLRVTAYLFGGGLLMLLTFSVLCAEDAVRVEPSEEPGVTDLRDFDFGSSIAMGGSGLGISVHAFYTSEDFAEGRVI